MDVGYSQSDGVTVDAELHHGLSLRYNSLTRVNAWSSGQDLTRTLNFTEHDHELWVGRGQFCRYLISRSCVSGYLTQGPEVEEECPIGGPSLA